MVESQLNWVGSWKSCVSPHITLPTNDPDSTPPTRLKLESDPPPHPPAAEIPLFHVLTARITFGNIFGVDEPVPHVSVLQEEERLSCVVDDAVFEPPAGYRSVGGYRERGGGGQPVVFVLPAISLMLSSVPLIFSRSFCGYTGGGYSLN